VSCAFSKELLALHVENDLPETEVRMVAKHVKECVECGDFVSELSHRQSQLKLLRREAIPQSTLIHMRREVLSRIENSPRALGWSVRIERTVWLGFRRHALVFTSLAIAAVSATLFAQMRQPALQDPAMSRKLAAVFAKDDSLIRPAGYRNWISVGSSMGSDVAGPHYPANSSSGFSRNVYIDQSAYREFSETGKFPEGAVLILETSRASDKQTISLEASVKDGRFDGGWGFFDFTNADGTLKDRTQSLSGAGNCRTCHEERAKYDHVFTQFHPALKTAT
jgi:hypothetical protein